MTTNKELADALLDLAEGMNPSFSVILRLAADRLVDEWDAAPDEEGWVEWHGGSVPDFFAPGQIVETRYRRGVIAYRIPK